MGLGDLFGGKKVELTVGTDKAAYLPGETVTATISIRGKKDVEIEEGRAELVYENEYTYQDEDMDDNTSTYTTTDSVRQGSARFLEAGTVASGADQAYTVALRVPDDAPPSGEGEITKVRWKVEAILPRRRARDTDAEAAFAVLSPRAAYASWADHVPEVDTHGDCDLELRVTGDKNLRPGDTVAGTLVVTPRSELEAEEVRVELARHEEVPRADGNEDETVEARTVLGEKPDLTAVVPREYPFELTVPGGICPSLRTEQSSVRWYLRGVVARRMHSDYNVKQELNVYTAP